MLPIGSGLGRPRGCPTSECRWACLAAGHLLLLLFGGAEDARSVSREQGLEDCAILLAGNLKNCPQVEPARRVQPAGMARASRRDNAAGPRATNPESYM